MDGYTTLRADAKATSEVVDRKSRFIAQLVHVESEQEAQAFIAEVRAQYFDARHHVFAWVLAGGQERQSDDGEPQRTSGMPTLEVLRGAGLKDVCCVTTRYFGGTLLGPGGLVRAYTAAAHSAVDQARRDGDIVEMTSVAPVSLRVEYAALDKILHMVDQAGGKVASTAYSDAVELDLVFRAGAEQAFAERVTEAFAGRVAPVAEPVRFAEF